MNRDKGAGIRENNAEYFGGFEAFRALVLAGGCDEVLLRQWQLNAAFKTHAYPFDAGATVVQGGNVVDRG